MSDVRALPTLDGPRLRLRPPELADLRTTFDWYNDPEVVAPYDRFTVDSFDDYARAVAAAPSDPASLAPRYVVELREPAAVVGVAGYYRAHPVLELTDVWYVIGVRDARGKGYGTEAVRLLVDHLFRATALGRVGATVDVENAPSCRLLERIGFHRDGVHRSGLFHHGRWHDVAVYGLTRDEWASRPPASGGTAAGAPPAR